MRYEQLDFATHQAMLHAASVALAVVVNGNIVPRGRLASVLSAPPAEVEGTTETRSPQSPVPGSSRPTT